MHCVTKYYSQLKLAQLKEIACSNMDVTREAYTIEQSQVNLKDRC